MGVNVDPTPPDGVDPISAPDDFQMSGGIDFDALTLRDLGSLSGPRVDAFQMVIAKSALERVHAHGQKTPAIEVCGVLVGDVYRDDHGPYLLIEHAIEGPSRGSAGQVTFTAETWQFVQSVMDRDYSHLRIIGWYHTHPNHGIFLSDMDLFLHENFFGLPWQAAMVYDPQRHEDGIFGWYSKPAERVDFLVVEDLIARSRPVLASAKQSRRQGPGFRRRLRQAVLAIVGLLLFAIAGYCLGMLVLQFHIKFPIHF